MDGFGVEDARRVMLVGGAGTPFAGAERTRVGADGGRDEEFEDQLPGERVLVGCVPEVGELQGGAQQAVEVVEGGAEEVVEEGEVEEALDARGQLGVLRVGAWELDREIGFCVVGLLAPFGVREESVVAGAQHRVVALAVAFRALPSCAVDDGGTELVEA